MCIEMINDAFNNGRSIDFVSEVITPGIFSSKS
jgi:hypothetical protein